MKKQNKKALIFSQRLAGYLMSTGFVLLEIIGDKTGSRRNVFVFNETDALCNAMANYKVSR